MSGSEESKAAVRGSFVVATDVYRDGIGGLRVTIDHQFTEGDYVATRFTMRGRHEGDILGVPATGTEVTCTGISISRCRDGKVVEEWEVCDVFGLLWQIGALPELDPGLMTP